ncbi:DUF2691 family protein [Wansuia hejianensis]|uniref:DUF2691 family protein n=1 Tax=Wansuia hejianensis TaxID=2763667 RepID=A0A7G9GCS1_9FIRM|nr:DUF2691 family protein [Wansuia hejianensis]QNM08603.1 DUF2691 family protein [Wansuia hejianensis]RHV90079.1 DUF2691 family protein [Lachnospiraceae bacterium OF09-33XD]
MIRGVSFNIPQLKSNTLWKIFSAIDINKYYWYIIQSQTEVWDNLLENDFFKQECYPGEEFSTCIQSNHYIVFLKLQAYSTFTNMRNMCEYNDYIKSDCQLILLVHDCEYVELYSKDQYTINLIYQRAAANGYKEIEYIMDNNDGRKVLDIL